MTRIRRKLKNTIRTERDERSAEEPLFRCDNQCSEKTLSFWQLASVVERGEPYTTSFCQKILQRFSEGKRRKNTDKLVVETVRRANGAQWKTLDNDGKRSRCPRNVGILWPRKRE